MSSRSDTLSPPSSRGLKWHTYSVHAPLESSFVSTLRIPELYSGYLVRLPIRAHTLGTGALSSTRIRLRSGLAVNALLFGTSVFQSTAYGQSLATPEERQQEPATETLQVRILTSQRDLPWVADIMGSDKVSGTIVGVGNTTLPMRCDQDDDPGYASYSVDISKDTDDNDESLAVQIVANNGTDKGG